MHFGINPALDNPPPNWKVSASNQWKYKQKYNPFLSYGQKTAKFYNGNTKNMNSQPNLLPDLQYTDNKLGSIFDRMSDSTNDLPVYIAIQSAINELLGSKASVLWISVPVYQILHAPAVLQSTPENKSIVGHCFKQNQILVVTNPRSFPQFDSSIDSTDENTMYIPLHSKKRILGVVVAMFGKNEIPESAVESARQFTAKFARYGHLFFDEDYSSQLMKSITSNEKTKSAIQGVVKQFLRIFSCRSVDFYQLGSKSTYYAYDVKKGEFAMVKGNVGASTFVLKNKVSLNLVDVTRSSDFRIEIDGNDSESMLSCPITQNSCITLRGKDHSSFSVSDELYLSSIAPLLSPLFSSNHSKSSEKGNDNSILNENDQNEPQSNSSGEEEGEEEEVEGFAERLKALLEVAEIMSGIMDIDNLVLTIMDRACHLLRTERCSLFLVDTESQELITRFQGGLDRQIRIPLSRGIVGYTATTGTIINIPDAYNDSRFDKTTDIKTGFRTRSILTVPIINNRGEIAGVTEMINRIDGGAFDDDDIKMMKAFNVFCGISLDNSTLYQTSLDLTRQLRSFIEMSNSLNTTETLKDVLGKVLVNCKSTIHATYAMLYLYDIEENKLSEFLKLGELPNPHSLYFVEQCLSLRNSTSFNAYDVVRISNCEKIGDSLDNVKVDCGNKLRKNGETKSANSSRKLGKGSETNSARSSTRVFSALDQEKNENENEEELNQFNKKGFGDVAVFPLMTADGKILGVMELSCRKLLQEDIKLLDCFATFASVSLEKSELEEIANLGHVEAEMKRFIDQEERSGFEIPKKLLLDEEKRNVIFTINFDAPLFDGINHFRVIWAIFNKFQLQQEFKITNERLFHFISEISESYKKVPYHNWRHAVDVTQFVTYELGISELDQYMTKFELLGLLVGAICHDANHDGFSNVYNEKAETPLGILFKDQSVMETHHCSVAISIISKEECNIFSALSPAEYKQIWTMIIKLILMTDMAKHHKCLQETNELLDKLGGKLDLNDTEQRALGMELVLKCADISNVSRPFEMANKWCDVLCEEFFRQGDLEKTSGMEYTSPLNDRAHLDKAKSQIGFYTFVCLPLYETAARALPGLQVNVDQVKSNLEVWKGQKSV